MITVVIVCHNLLELTTKCVDAVRNSPTRKKKEIIIVDNGSTDNTEEWANQQKEIVYLKNQVNLGCAIARNQGAKWARGNHILFLDNDQFVSKGDIQGLLDLNMDVAGVEHWEAMPNGITKPRTDDIISNQSYIGAGGMLVRKDIFLRLGGFDERFAPAWYEDVDFSFRAMRSEFSIGVLLDHGVVHFNGGGNTSTSQKTYSSGLAKKASRDLFCKLWGGTVLDKPKIYIGKRPVISVVIDVLDWAWDFKAKQIAKHLAARFDIKISVGLPEDHSKLLFTFEHFREYEKLIKFRYALGVTAHTYKNHANFEKYLQSAVATHANSVLLFNEIRHLNKRCYYLPNGVDEKIFSFKERDISRPFTVGYVGKNNERKGFETYIVLACNKADVQLKAKCGKHKSVDRLKHEDMPSFYKDVDLVLIASDMDGTPNQLLEAAAVGRTFIGCKIGNVPEFVQEGVNGFMVERRVDAYVDKLMYLKKRREECQQMGIKARETVESGWSWKTQSQNYAKMFREIL